MNAKTKNDKKPRKKQFITIMQHEHKTLKLCKQTNNTRSDTITLQRARMHVTLTESTIFVAGSVQKITAANIVKDMPKETFLRISVRREKQKPFN